MSVLPSQLRITEGLLLAGIPVVGYGCAFLYELAFATAFGFPISFINVSTLRIFVVVGILAVIASQVWLILGIIPRKPWFAPVLLCLPGVVMWLVASSIRNSLLVNDRPAPWFVWAPFYLFSIFLIVGSLIAPIAKYKAGAFGSWQHALHASASTQPDNASFAVLDYAVARGIDVRSWLVIYFLVIGTLAASYAAGKHVSGRQTEFLVPSTTRDFVVLRRYDEYFVTAKFDRTSRTLKQEYLLIPITSDKLGSCNTESIGSLSKPRPQ